MNSGTHIIFDFSEPDDQDAWRSIDDVVMGGVSTSAFKISRDGHGVFHGVVSLDRGGGFASVRSKPTRVDLRGFTGLELRARGDDQRYRLRLLPEAGLDDVGYQATFDTRAGVWELIRLPFENFRPRFHGTQVPEAPPLDLTAITSFGLLIADRQAGPFRLEIAWLRAFA